MNASHTALVLSLWGLSPWRKHSREHSGNMENLSVLAFPVGPSSSQLHPAHIFSRFEEPLCCCFWRWCSRRDYATASTESVEIRSCKCSDTKNATFLKNAMPNQLDMCFWPKCRQCYHQFTTWFCVAQRALVKIFATKYWFDTSKGYSCETTSRDHQSTGKAQTTQWWLAVICPTVSHTLSMATTSSLL